MKKTTLLAIAIVTAVSSISIPQLRVAVIGAAKPFFRN
jgi:hypothetical protein